MSFIQTFGSTKLENAIIYNFLGVSIDSTDISDATIDGTNVKEITIDGDVAWKAANVNVIDDFEDGISAWNNNGISGGTQVSFATQGNNALRVEADGSNGSYVRDWNPPSSGTITLKFDIAYENIQDFCSFTTSDTETSGPNDTGFNFNHKGMDSNNDLEIRAETRTVVYQSASDNTYYSIEIEMDFDNNDIISVTVDGQTTNINESFQGTPINHIGYYMGDEGSDNRSWVDNIRYE